ncbi:MAG: CHAD domain-containing protein [Tunicatimonas sp.]
MSIQINLQESVQVNVQRIMQARIDRCREHLRHDAPHQAIHQTRKQLKKIRALLRLVRYQIGDETYQAANHYFRDAARLISDARDVSASWETAEQLQALLTTARDRQAVGRLKRHLRAKKGAITRYQVHGGQLLQSVQDALADAEQFHRAWTISDDGFEAVEKGIRSIYKQCQKRQAVAYAQFDTEAFHQWRKSVKYLRYQVDTLSPLWPGTLQALESELNRLTDFLGNDHDLMVLGETIEHGKLMPPAPTRSVLATLEEQRTTQQEAALPLALKLFDQKPKQFVADLARWWQVEAEWRDGVTKLVGV